MAFYIGQNAEGSYTTGNVGTVGGWNNTEKAIWGTTSGEGFYFANSTVLAAYGASGNEAFVWNGSGGSDSILLGTYGDGTINTTAQTFNLSQLVVGAGQTYQVTGTTLSDTFKWVDGVTAATSTYSLNGGVGTDTLQLANTGATTDFALANITMTNMEFVTGSDANDKVVWAGTGGYSFDLAAGTDTLSFGVATTAQDVRLSNLQFKNIEHLIGTSLADTLGGSSSTDTLDGGAAADRLWGAAGADSMIGGAGADTYYFGSGDGQDSIAADATNSASDVVLFQGAYGTAAFADLTFAAGTNNLTIGIGGVDSLVINDWASYAQTTTIKDNRISKFVASDLTFGLAMGNATASSLFGTDSTLAYYMQASNAGDKLKSGTTADTLKGGTGNDSFQFTATSGAVLFDGGTGTDVLSAADYATAGVSVYLQNETTKYKNIENLTGSSLADKLGGNSLANEIIGGSGADSIYGAAGNDTLTGGAGADSYWFGTGDGTDSISDAGVANGKDDAVIFWANAFSDLSFALGSTSGANADIDISINNTTDKLILIGAGTASTGNSFDRVNKFITTDMTFGLSIANAGGALKGTSIADYILGAAGNDSINGYAGVDAIYGKAGNDTIVYSTDSWIDGGADTDVVTAEYATAGVTIELASSRISNVEKLIGSAYADKLGGTSAAETLVGGDGADSLWGGAGADSLEGGIGADSYWFGVGNGADTIATHTYNNLDSVVFYGSGVGGGGITSTIVSGNNLTIGLSSGDSLTLVDWNLGGGNKLNKFVFQDGTGAGTYSLAVDGANTATWTLIS